jgi:LCP family protein required for cell wall assembly
MSHARRAHRGPLRSGVDVHGRQGPGVGRLPDGVDAAAPDDVADRAGDGSPAPGVGLAAAADKAAADKAAADKAPAGEAPDGEAPDGKAPDGVTVARTGLAEAVRVRRAVSLLVLSALLPGSAQLVGGRRQLGRVALRVWAGLLVPVLVLAGMWVADRSLALSLLTRPSVLGLLAVVLFLLAVAVPALVVDAWRLGRPGDLPLATRRWLAGGTAVLMLATSAPLVLAGRRFWVAADLVGGIFGGNAATGTADGRYNVLLLGGDAGSDRVGLRPDSVTLASIDATTGRTVLLSLPRNLQNVPFPAGSRAAKALPGGWSCGDSCLLNAVYTWGGAHPDLFPGARDPGAEAMKQAVSAVTGLTVSYYVLIDLHGFRALVDAMGGIDLTVSRRVPIGGGTSKVVGYIEPGRRHLDGWHALWYARSRHGSSDYERMQRQRCVMSAMAGQLDPATLLQRFRGVAAASQEVVSTDVPASDLGTFLDLGLAAKQQPITSVQFVPPIITPARPDYGVIRSRVAAAVETAERPVPSPRASTQGRATARPSGAAPSRTGTPGSPSAPGTDTAAGGTDVASVCAP